MDPEQQQPHGHGDDPPAQDLPYAEIVHPMVTVPLNDGDDIDVKKSDTKQVTKDKRRLLLISAAALVVTVIITVAVVAGVAASRPKSEPESVKSQSEEEKDCPTAFSGRALASSSRRLQVNQDFDWIGCFHRETSTDVRFLDSNTDTQEQAQACNDHCFTSFFGIVGSTCYCFPDLPSERLAIGTCDSVCSVELTDRMEVYFKMNLSDECNQDTTSSVRNFLVEEDDAPFGFDIVSNEFRSSPFELYKDECGTNIYEVQTEISEGSNELSTSVSKVSEFAQEHRRNLSASIKTSASGGRKGLFVKASVSVSASLDVEQNNMFQSSGAESSNSRVFTSLGVKRLAEVQLLDFANKRHFVTFSPQFGRQLRRYKENGFSDQIAEEIFDTYGMFVMERGIFGGFMQLRTTATDSDFSRLFSSEEESRQCFEASVSGRASGFGFKGSFSVEGGACREGVDKEVQSLQTQYSKEVSEQAVIGGKIEDGEFVVSPEFSTLLTTKDKYPPGDDGIRLRLLSDFLVAEKINPLEVKRLLLTEEDFADIQVHLEEHILLRLQAFEALIGSCGDCDLPYLQQTSDGFECQCYGPKSNMNVFVTSTNYNGNLGGVSGADEKCNAAASSAGLKGTFKAWLASSPADDPESRFVGSDNPYTTVNGDLLANSFSEFLQGGSLLNNYFVDEFGNTINAGEGGIATPLRPDGTFDEARAETCNGYTTASSAVRTNFIAVTTKGEKTLNTAVICEFGKMRLLCVEQG